MSLVQAIEVKDKCHDFLGPVGYPARVEVIRVCVPRYYTLWCSFELLGKWAWRDAKGLKCWRAATRT
jgi:hypothetical protein